MNPLDYDMIFKRKSFHRFQGARRLSESKLVEIERAVAALTPLDGRIRTAFKIVPRAQTTCRRGEYCILIYSEKKEHSLLNAGYMGEQLDLWLAANDIGACWYGMGKTGETAFDGLDFVIMIAIEQAEPGQFRRDYTKAKRKKTAEIWTGRPLDAVASVVKYAPSACNAQPWLAEYDGDELKLYRTDRKRGILPADRVPFYGRIDMGIFLLFTELCLAHEGISFTRRLPPEPEDGGAKILTAVYELAAG